MELVTSLTEENYLKAIFKINERTNKPATTNAISQQLSTTAASVTDMLKRLAEKELINYQPYKGVTLSSTGNKIATNLIRRHRLWEVFLFQKLNFAWEQVHDIAEDLEHIKSDELINRLDNYLGNPRFDPHGDPIPNAQGKFTIRNQISIDQLQIGEKGILVGVKEHDTDFLQYLNELEIKLGSEFELLEKVKYDESLKILKDQKDQINLSNKVSKFLLVKKMN